MIKKVVIKDLILSALMVLILVGCIWLRRLGKDNQGIKALQKVNKTVLKATLNHCTASILSFLMLVPLGNAS
jgi:hypothetical protein